MSRFNQSVKNSKVTENHEGETAYKLSPELELYSLSCTSLMQPKFYEKDTEQLDRLRDLIKKCSPEFVVKLAIYAREQMYLRTIPIVLVVELAKIHKGDNLISKATERIIQRADEITEMLAYYQFANNRTELKKLNKLSKQIQIGIANSFHKFNEYKFAKYNRKTEVKLKDALFLCHAKPLNEEEDVLFKKIINDNLSVPYTWETMLSEAGQKGEDKKVIWEELIDSNKVGYMAMLRNLRNMLDAKISNEHMIKVTNFLKRPDNVRNSKQLPFRYFSAYRELEQNASINTDMILGALEEAVKVSIGNVKGLDCNVLIASDVSGSMESTISARSSVELYDIGLLLGQLLKLKSPSSICGFFGDIWKVKRFTGDTPLQNTLRLHECEGEVGYSTNGYKVIEWLLQNKTVMDKVFIFTDCQMWDSYTGSNTFKEYWNQYKQLSPNAKLYLFDLNGYGNTPINTRQNDVYLISGWSEKVFDMLDSIDNGTKNLQAINTIQI
ncbi:MAG: TROVE domain-containing protein [bacterium]